MNSNYAIRGFILNLREFVEWDGRVYFMESSAPVCKLRASDIPLLQALENAIDERDAARLLSVLRPPTADESALSNAAETLRTMISSRLLQARALRQEAES